MVYEALRLSYGLTMRLPRVSPDEPVRYKDYLIPAKVCPYHPMIAYSEILSEQTPMSSSSYLIHRNETIFPDHATFDPERWVRASEEGKHLNRYITSFTRGTRQCLGMKYEPP